MNQAKFRALLQFLTTPSLKRNDSHRSNHLISYVMMTSFKNNIENCLVELRYTYSMVYITVNEQTKPKQFSPANIHAFSIHLMRCLQLNEIFIIFIHYIWFLRLISFQAKKNILKSYRFFYRICSHCWRLFYV